MASVGSPCGRPNAIWGAALAACFTANAAFHALLGRPVALTGSYSLWERGRCGDTQGPSAGIVDVGRVLQAGAGAVGSALDHWLTLVGLAGDWLIVDGDIVTVDNLNRQIYFLAADTDFAGDAERKANVVAARMGGVARADTHWYGEISAIVEGTYDVVLALANEHGARSLLQARRDPLLLHATTSPSWQAQLHRHVLGIDDCILCRIPEPVAQMSCSKGAVAPRQPDAALPFLSASASLLLAAELVRLQHGLSKDGKENFHSLILPSPQPAVQAVTHSCVTGCP